jgi:hypothetical protein
MPQPIRHEEIVRQFVDSKAIDFNALGKFVAELGPSLAISSRGDYGVRIGFYNVLACFNIGPRLVSPVDIASSGITSEVVGE